MIRQDLLSLTVDDLTSLTNRGTVKRAQKELDSSEWTVVFEEGPDDRLVARWSDGVTCEFFSGKPIQNANCSSGSLGISRFIVRTVLAYQRYVQGSQSTRVGNESVVPEIAPDSQPPTGTQPTIEPRKWDPGEWTDQQLIERFGKGAIERAKIRFQRGTLVEVSRGSKPYALFLDEKCYVRFMVPGDLHYVLADCKEDAMPKFVAMAVWAFQQLPKDQTSGLLSIQQQTLATPTTTLRSVLDQIDDWFAHGMANSLSHRIAKWQRLEQEVRQEGLSWPADILLELIQQMEMYSHHDALFDPDRIIDLVGELLARIHAILNEVNHVPQILIRGTHGDSLLEIASANYVALGLDIHAGKKNTTICVHFQEATSGMVASLVRSFADEVPSDSSQSTPKTPRSYQQLVETNLVRGTSLAILSRSNLRLKTGKRKPSGELVLPRTGSSLGIQPQSYRWEDLKPPLLVEDFTYLKQRLEMLPPSYLLPREVTQGIFVVPISRLQDVSFSVPRQMLIGSCFDGRGMSAELRLKFEGRNQEAFQSFWQALRSPVGTPKFVVGRFRTESSKLIVRPISVIFEVDSIRRCASPYLIDPMLLSSTVTKQQEESIDLTNEGRMDFHDRSPMEDFLVQLREGLAENLVLGMAGHLTHLERIANALLEKAESLGILRIGRIISLWKSEIERCRQQRSYSFTNGTQLACQLALIAKVGAES